MTDTNANTNANTDADTDADADKDTHDDDDTYQAEEQNGNKDEYKDQTLA